ISEFISVAMHSTKRFEKKATTQKNVIGIWGDGNLGYVVSLVLKSKYPDSKIVVVGQNPSKLQYFSFADETYLSSEVPEDFSIDHAFECTGGEGCQSAVNHIIKHINPEGLIMLLGVSENKVPIFTRDVLEKGLTLIGSSRSSYEDFKNTVEFLKNKDMQKRFKTIVSDVVNVSSIEDISKAFDIDSNNPFKTVMQWDI
ncbi:MAG: ribitol-5-phosphate dehydrogenase, partial [Oscillospiraceae bacterium]|nr:ribitol-5-phosphate dehydrogenase [Oscillospiraceae bacterium]